MAHFKEDENLDELIGSLKSRHISLNSFTRIKIIHPFFNVRKRGILIWERAIDGFYAWVFS